MGFRDTCKFNIAMLAKQGWRIMTHPASLLASVLKVKYFPNSDFLSANLGNNPSYVWKSLWATKGILKQGVCWRVGNGNSILVNKNSWVLGNPNFKITSPVVNSQIVKVVDLFAVNEQKWNKEVIETTFSEIDTAHSSDSVGLYCS